MLGVFAFVALLAAPDPDPFEEIRALDAAAGFELEAIKSRCTDSTQSDVEAAAAAERAAHIHQTRIGLARKVAGPGMAEELVPLAYQAADAFARQFACDATKIDPLVAARELLAGLRAELADATSRAAQALDRRVAELDAQIAAFDAALPPTVERPPEVRIVTVEGRVSPVRKDSFMGRLALRLEGGANFTRADEPPTYFYHRGGYFRAAILARHQVGRRGRVHLLFGPYYGFSSSAWAGTWSPPQSMPDATAPWYAGRIAAHRIGGQFEVQWVPAAVLEKWLSINPAVEVGFEQQNYFGRGAFRSTAFQAGGGLALCVWHQSVCPGARALATPIVGGQAVVSMQAGVALDILRFVDIGLGRTPRAR